MRDLLHGKKDISLRWFWLAALLLTAAKLAACALMYAYYCPPLAPLDDDLMFRAAVSITEGEWLGPYGWKTIAKHMGFAVWLALLHLLHIPYVVGGQLLWAGASAFAAWAFWPLLKKRWQALLLYLVLLFDPAAVASFTFRVYRDNIFPALCLLVFAGFSGYALRGGQKLSRSLPLLAGAGFGLGAAYLSREDGLWLLPFVAGAMVITAFYILRERGGSGKVPRLLAMALPIALAGGMVLGYCAMNQAYYGRFIVSDFTSREFKDAYGAMTRIRHDNWTADVAVPADVREKLYETVPAFAELREDLEGDWIANGYRNSATGDFRSGAFYWALRECVSYAGHYESAAEAEAYYRDLAQQINALCDSGVLPAGPRRSATTPPIRAAYILPTLEEGARSLWTVLTFRQTNPRVEVSVGSPEEIAAVEDFLYTPGATAAVPNTASAYLSLPQRLVYLGFDGVRAVYMVLTPLAFAGALWAFVRRWVRALTKKAPGQSLLPLWIATGVLGMALLRCFMIAFVEVSSFGIGTYIMYLSTVHPLILLFSFFGAGDLLCQAAQKREKKKEKRGMA